MSMKSDGACPECRATQVMIGVMVEDLDRGFCGEAQLRVDRDPGALIFKESVRSELRACVCSQCGHVELYVANPLELWDAYQAVQEQQRRTAK